MKSWHQHKVKPHVVWFLVAAVEKRFRCTFSKNKQALCEHIWLICFKRKLKLIDWQSNCPLSSSIALLPKKKPDWWNFSVLTLRTPPPLTKSAHTHYTPTCSWLIIIRAYYKELVVVEVSNRDGVGGGGSGGAHACCDNSFVFAWIASISRWHG